MVQIMAHSARTFLTPRNRKLAEAACLFDLSEHRLHHLRRFEAAVVDLFCASVASAVHRLFPFAAVGCWARPVGPASPK